MTTETTTNQTRSESFFTPLFRQVDIAPLVFFRIFFGAIMLWEVTRYFDHGWISRYFIDPQFHFKYYGFGWVQALPGDWMYGVFYLMGFVAILIILGLFYRLAAITMFVVFTYMFLLDQARYLNHFYLISLVSFLMIFVPANRALAIDTWIRPKIRSQKMDVWVLWLLRFQVGVPYFFGGIAKLNGDWLQGEPMRMWLSSRTDFPLIGQFFTDEWMVYSFAYGGLLLDLLVVFFLLWKRTRWIAYVPVLLFHLSNHVMFNIGIFPWFMIGATLIFFEPARFRQAWNLLWALPRRLLPASDNTTQPQSTPPKPLKLSRAQWAMSIFLVVWVAYQVLYPLRHFLYPGDPNWTEEGHNFSWHMKLRDKEGTISFYVTDRNANFTWDVDPYDYLLPHQARKVFGRPPLILQFAHYLEDVYAAQGFENVEVRVIALVSLNGRTHTQLIDPTVDLTEYDWSLAHVDWILPLDRPLKETVVSNPANESSQ